MSSENEAIAVKNSLESQRAYLAHLQGNDTLALSQLEGKNDSYSIRRRLEVHLDAEQFDEAASIIRDRPFDAVWCDKAVFALARIGELQAARGIVDWAKDQSDRTTWRRCLLRYASARYQKALERIGLGESILPGDLLPEESDAMRDTIAALQPNLLAIESVGRVENELESQSVQLALHASALQGDHSLTAKLVGFLNTRMPVPLTLPRLALEHIIIAEEGLSSRLREGHPDSFDARILALLLDADQQRLPTAPFEAAKMSVPMAANVEDRVRLCKVLNEMAQRLGPSALAEVDIIASTILPADHPLRRQLYADRMVRGGRPEEARTALDEIRDEKDAYWLQLYAHYLLLIGDGKSAADYFARASKIYPNPSLLRIAAVVARDFNRLPLAQNALERFLKREPNAVPEHIELAMIYVRQSLFAKAADQFELLCKLDPNDEEHRFHLAVSLRRAGRLQDSLNEFNAITTHLQPPLRHLIARAELLKSMGRAAEGFDSLFKARDTHWENYQFVVSVLNLAYAAQKDDIANEALAQLKRLQQAGNAPPEVLQQLTLDDLKDEISKYRERIDVLCRAVLQNRLPWLVADNATGYPSYWSWTVRTHEIDWILDDPITRSQQTLYATNCFAVHKSEMSEGTLELIEAANSGDAVVIDMSALITLHSLELLDKAMDYFGHLYIPAAYITTGVSDTDRLKPHQPSRVAATEAIRMAIDTGTLHVASKADSPGQRPFPFVSEHTLEEDVKEHYYRLVDVLEAIYLNGRISESEKKSWLSVAHMPTGVDSLHPTLGANDSVLVQLSTLMTIAEIGGLRYILDTFSVHLSENDRNEVLRESAGYALQKSVLAKHEDLWKRVREDVRVIQKPVQATNELEADRDGLKVFIESALLAQSESKPLFADDRTLQCLVLNARSGVPSAAFGTDSFLAALHTSSRLSTSDYYRSILQLIEWRYRFIIPTPEMLKAFALEYIGNPPGRKLLLVARYMHESMQDPGLLAGFEPSTPPVSIASRLFLSLTGVVAEFIMDLWLDESVMGPVAMTITAWAMREMLPSAPKNMGLQGDLITSMRPRLIMSKALIRGCTATNVERANAGLRAIALSLGMDEAEYWMAITEIINDV